MDCGLCLIEVDKSRAEYEKKRQAEEACKAHELFEGEEVNGIFDVPDSSLSALLVAQQEAHEEAGQGQRGMSKVRYFPGGKEKVWAPPWLLILPHLWTTLPYRSSQFCNYIQASAVFPGNHCSSGASTSHRGRFQGVDPTSCGRRVRPEA